MLARMSLKRLPQQRLWTAENPSQAEVLPDLDVSKMMRTMKMTSWKERKITRMSEAFWNTSETFSQEQRVLLPRVQAFDVGSIYQQAL
jgi:hypothetical protein